MPVLFSLGALRGGKNETNILNYTFDINHYFFWAGDYLQTLIPVRFSGFYSAVLTMNKSLQVSPEYFDG